VIFKTTKANSTTSSQFAIISNSYR